MGDVQDVLSTKPSLAYVDKIKEQTLGTPVLNTGATILENIMSRYRTGYIRGGFPVAPKAGATTGAPDGPDDADIYGYVSWFKMSSDEIWVTYYAENSLKKFDRLVISGNWQGGRDWELS